jgi:hypothetical protein
MMALVRWVALVAGLVTLMVSADAAAQLMPAVPEPAPVPADEKSPWIATGLALGATVGTFVIGGVAETLDDDHASPVTTVVLIGSLVLSTAAPSAGHLYADELDHAFTWTAIRMGGLAVGVAGTALAVDGFDDDRGYWFPAAAAAAVGFTAYSVGMCWDIVDAHRAARRANRRAQPRMTLAPVAGEAFGVSLVGVF